MFLLVFVIRAFYIYSPLFEAGVAREVVNTAQKLRKKAGLEPSDIIELYFEPIESSNVSLLIQRLPTLWMYFVQLYFLLEIF